MWNEKSTCTVITRVFPENNYPFARNVLRSNFPPFLVPLARKHFFFLSFSPISDFCLAGRRGGGKRCQERSTGDKKKKDTNEEGGEEEEEEEESA